MDALAEEWTFGYARAAKASSYATMKIRTRGRQSRGGEFTLHWVRDGDRESGSTLVLQERELQRLTRVLPPTCATNCGSRGARWWTQTAQAIATGLADSHPAYRFFDGAASHCGSPSTACDRTTTMAGAENAAASSIVDCTYSKE